MVYCPDATEVSAIVGETFAVGAQARDNCSYSGASMNISFAFFGGSQTGELEKMRQSEVEGGTNGRHPADTTCRSRQARSALHRRLIRMAATARSYCFDASGVGARRGC